MALQNLNIEQFCLYQSFFMNSWIWDNMQIHLLLIQTNLLCHFSVTTESGLKITYRFYTRCNRLKKFKFWTVFTVTIFFYGHVLTGTWTVSPNFIKLILNCLQSWQNPFIWPHLTVKKLLTLIYIIIMWILFYS